MLKKMTIGKRVLMISGFLCLMLAGIGFFSVYRLWSINKTTTAIVSDSLPGILKATAINARLADNEIRIDRMLLAKTAGERQQIKEGIAAENAANAEALKQYEQAAATPEERKNIEDLKQKRQVYAGLRENFFTLVETNHAEAQLFAAEQIRPAFEAYLKAGDVLMDYNAQLAGQRGRQIMAEVKAGIVLILVVSMVALVAGVVFSIVSTRRITSVLTHVSDVMGDGANQVTSAATQVSASSQSLAEGASEQAASLEETSSSLEEIASMTKRNEDSANKAKQLAGEARKAADTGATAMQSMSTAMEAIKLSSAEIAKIIKTIDEIAFQTNILALNAAVEATRAGDAGMGFAAVADEVRNLAQRSAHAARETADKIEGAIARTEQGVQNCSKVAEELQEIVQKVRAVDDLIAEVAAASREQSQGIEQVNIAVSQMDKVTQGNAASAEEGASAAEELNVQAHALKDAIAELTSLTVGMQTSRTSAAKTAAHKPVHTPEEEPVNGTKTQAATPKPRNGTRLIPLHPKSVFAMPPRRNGNTYAMESFKDF